MRWLVSFVLALVAGWFAGSVAGQSLANHYCPAAANSACPTNTCQPLPSGGSVWITTITAFYACTPGENECTVAGSQACTGPAYTDANCQNTAHFQGTIYYSFCQ